LWRLASPDRPEIAFTLPELEPKSIDDSITDSLSQPVALTAA
jgi:hypothetical protein